MKKFIKNNFIFILPILSGVLLILAYPPYDLEFLIWFALIPLFWFVFAEKINPKKAFIGGTICGIVFFGKLFDWLFATYPFEWLGINAEQSKVPILILLIILYIIQTVFLGLFFGIFTRLCLILRIKHFAIRRISYLLIIPALWIVFEYLRAWGFGILYFGKESLLGPHWTFGNLAYTLHNKSNLIQIADLGGIYLISFLIVLVNMSLFLILKRCVRLNLTHIAVLLIILGLVGTAWVGYGIYKSNNLYESNGSYKIALLQTNFSSGAEFNSYQKKEVFDAVLGLFQSTQESADIIIAPEGFGIVGITKHTKIAKYLLEDFYKPGQIYLENNKIIEHKKTKSRLFYYDLEAASPDASQDGKENPIGFHDKMLLVPNGDFLPYLTKILLNIYSLNIEHEKRLYTKGDKIEPINKIGGTICSGIISPKIQREMTKKDAEFLVSVSSDAPFHGAKALLAQNLAMSKLRAVENRRYFAQATNMGYSFLLNSKGEIIAKSNKLGNEILFEDVRFLKKKTVYSRFGDWIIILSTATLLLTFILCYNKKSELL